MDNKKLCVTVVVPVRDDDANLSQCLATLYQFDEVIVVDSGFRQSTHDIALAAGARYEPFQFTPPYPKKRNWILDNRTPRNSWVLFLDADERVTEKFVDELKSKITSNSRAVGYWLHYQNYFLGRPLRYGLPQKKLALFVHTAGRYERIDDPGWSAYDMEIHEHPVLQGETETIRSKIEHLDHRPMASFIQKHVEYAKWEAGRVAELSRQEARFSLTFRQRVKYSLIRSALMAPMYFVYTYFVRLGFLDGKAGLAYAMLKLNYFTQIYLLTREKDFDAQADNANNANK